MSSNLESIKRRHWLRQRQILIAVAVEFNMEQGYAPRHTFGVRRWNGGRFPERIAREAVTETDLLHAEMSLLQPLAPALSSIAVG